MRTVTTSDHQRARWRGLAIAGLTWCIAAGAPLPAGAGGFDTPILYSARHIGMGGTGISYVYDPTALFLNPAGLQHTDFISLTANFSPILAENTAPPCVTGSCSEPVSTGKTLAPAFLVGGAFRVADWATVGIGVYPLASAGGGYEYTHPNPTQDGLLTDETTIRFIEISPGVAFHGERWSIGLGYRITITQLERFQKDANSSSALLDLDLSGVDALGFRLGIQIQPIDEISIGVVYRHKITPTITGDSGSILNKPLGDLDMELVLPSRLGFGMRGDIPLAPGMHLGIACDVEYAFQSQNGTSTIKGKDEDGEEIRLDSIFRWQDAVTVRAGVELGVIERLNIRAGYIWDEQTSNRNYPSAFGTPPTDTHSVTAGIGWKADSWEVNGAYAYRHGETVITDEDREGFACLTCSGPGLHQLTLHGAYLDFSWYFR